MHSEFNGVERCAVLRHRRRKPSRPVRSPRLAGGRALRDNGWTVSVICPVSERYSKRYEVLEDIAIYRHPLPFEAHGKLAFLFEYLNALFHEGRLLMKVAFTRGFDVIQVCNPPDVLFLNALPYKLFGKRLSSITTIYAPSFSSRSSTARASSTGCCSPPSASPSNAPTSSFRPTRPIGASRSALRKKAGGCGHGLQRAGANAHAADGSQRSVAQGPRIVLGYVGVIGQQDGVDHFVRMLHYLRKDHGRDDVVGVVVGDGPALGTSRELARELGLTDRSRLPAICRAKICSRRSARSISESFPTRSTSTMTRSA